MKRLIRCLFIVCILCFSVSPVYARAGGGGGGSGGGGGGGSSSSGHTPHSESHPASNEDRAASVILFILGSYSLSCFEKYRRRYKAISMHKAMKKELKEKMNELLNKNEYDEFDLYYITSLLIKFMLILIPIVFILTVQKHTIMLYRMHGVIKIWILLNNIFLPLFMTNGKQNSIGGSMKVYVMNSLISDFLKQWL